MGLLHKVSEKIAYCMDKEQNDYREHVLMIYGIELILNELIKVIAIIIVAAIIKKITIAIFSMTYLYLSRKYSGGGHLKSQWTCITVSVVACFLGPVIVEKITMNDMIIIPIIAEAILIFIWIPDIKEFTGLYAAYVKKKIMALMIFIIGITLSWMLGGTCLVNGVLFCEAIVLLFARMNFDK